MFKPAAVLTFVVLVLRVQMSLSDFCMVLIRSEVQEEVHVQIAACIDADEWRRLRPICFW